MTTPAHSDSFAQRDSFANPYFSAHRVFSAPRAFSSFEFCFQFSDNPFNEPGELGRSWGRFAINLDGTPLFRECGTNKPGLEWNLLYLRDWLTDDFWK